MNPTRLTIIYSGTPIFIGPLVFLLGYSFTRGGGDYCDRVHYLPGGSLDPKQIIEFRNAQIFQITGAGVMLLLGLFIITYLFTSSRRRSSRLNTWTVLAVIFAMLGYVFVILSSGKSGQVC